MYTLATLFVLYIGCIVFIRTRNSEHFALSRQLSDFSTFMVPFNLPAYLLSKIPTTHVVSTDKYPELKKFEDNWETIRDEALKLYEEGHITQRDDLPGSSFYKDKRWGNFYLKNFDNEIPSAHTLAPKTMALIDDTPSMCMAVFACLNPGKTINSHHDPFAFTLRYSLGLKTPNDEKCGLMVNGEHYQWQDGKGILFDETYFHNAYNETDKPRIILMTDVERPLYSRFLQRVYYRIGNFFNSLFAVDNVDTSMTGIGNKFGVHLNKVKAALKRFKHWNKPLYILFKLCLVGGLLYLIFF